MSLACPPPIHVQCIGDTVAHPPHRTVEDFIAAGGEASNFIDFRWAGDTSDGQTCPETISREYQITDDYGNIISCTQTIIVDDEIAPVIQPNNEKITIECTENYREYRYTTIEEFIAATGATDNCGIDYSYFPTPQERRYYCPDVREYTYQIRDLCGNIATYKQTITIINNGPDYILGPQARRGCEIPPPFEKNQFTLHFNNGDGDCEIIIDTIIVSEPEIVVPDCPGEIRRTYTFIDECGDAIVIFTERFYVEDDTPPEFVNAPATISIECDEVLPEPYADYDAFWTAGGEAIDGCTMDEASFRHLPGQDTVLQENCPRIIVRTYEIYDWCGNWNTFKDTLYINDTTPPVAGLPETELGPYKFIEDIPEPYGFEDLLNVADNCGGEVMIIDTLQAVESSYPDSIIRGYVITDECGNQDTLEQKIYLHNDSLLKFDCLPLYTDSIFDCISKVPEPFTAEEFFTAGGTASSYCGIDTASFRLVYETQTGSDCNGSITRAYEITDLCGRTSTCEHTIRFRDDIVPILICPPDVVVEAGEEIPDLPLPMSKWKRLGGDATDNCDLREGLLRREFEETYYGIAADTILRTFRIGDACNNFDVCTQTIIVKKEINVELECPPLPVTEVECKNELPEPYASYNAFENAGGYAYSDCGIVPETFEHLYDEPSGEDNCITSVTRYYQILDECGTSITCSQVFIINDQTAPVLSGIPADTTVACITDVPPVPEVTATDNCGGYVSVEFSETVTDSTCANGLTIVRTWTATDDCGNDTSEVQTIWVDDQVPPEITCPDSVTFDAGIGELESLTGLAFTETEQTITAEEFADSGISATDNCAVDFVTYRDTISGICPMVVSRTFTVYDVCGNSVSCTQVIELYTTFNPEFEPIGPICQFAEAPELPVADRNGITGIWLPATISTSVTGTFEFVFTPDDIYDCAAIDTIEIAITPATVPEFDPAGPFCVGETPPELPAADLNGIPGTWNPAVINTSEPGLTEYIFTPNDSYECALNDTLLIEVLPEAVPEFSSIESLFMYETPPQLPESDLNDITGTWMPDSITTNEPGVFEYIFTPDPEFKCILSYTITVEVMPPEVPEISCPDLMTKECFDLPFSTPTEFIDAGGSYLSYWEPDSLILKAESVISESCPKTTIREYQIKNVNGDTSNTCIHKIIIDDLTNPIIKCPPDITVDGNQNIPPRFTLDEFIDAGGTLSDNCKIDSLSFGLMSEFMDTTLTPDVLKRTYHIADECLNYNICLHRITIENATMINIDSKSNLQCNIFPNPNDGIFNLVVNGIKDNIISIDISNINGKHVYNKEISPELSQYKGQIDLSGNASGIYNMKINDGKYMVVKSIVIR